MDLTPALQKTIIEKWEHLKPSLQKQIAETF